MNVAEARSSVRNALSTRLDAELRRIRAADLYRVRRVIDGNHGADIVVDGRRCINFCSNDYLGLAGDPRLAVAAKRALDHAGVGSGGSALISGYNAEHRALEEALADFTGRPRALLFSSGWAANLGVLRGLLRRGDAIVADELNHASLIDGGRLSGADYRRVPHRDLAAYEATLSDLAAAPAGALSLIVSDSLFSMDGDIAELPALRRLGRRFDAPLMIDDAHGFGVLGEHGRGAVEMSSDSIPDIYVATLAKAIGAAGAFVAGDEDLIEYLVQRARSWIFSTAPPPAVAAAAHAGLRIAREEPEHRQRLHANIRQFVDGARRCGLPLGQAGEMSSTAIQPLLTGDEARTLAMSRGLFERGYWVAAIRPPTVPRGTSRLRITLSAAHRPAQVDGLLNALGEVWEAVGSESEPA